MLNSAAALCGARPFWLVRAHVTQTAAALLALVENKVI
jgi:hypothetical protein